MISQGRPSAYNLILTSDNKKIFVIIGDSNANGTATIITTCAADTLWNWDGSTDTEITTQGIANNFPQYGSIWQPLATAYKASTTRKTLLSNTALGGSRFQSGAAASSWATTGDLYNLSLIKTRTSMTYHKIKTVAAIIINLGINDFRTSAQGGSGGTGVLSGAELTAITNAADSLITRLNTDYGTPPIIMIQQGRSEFFANAAGINDVNTVLANLDTTYANVKVLGDRTLYTVEADLLHYDNVCENYLAGIINTELVAQGI